ncbi:MAG: hypothetical protein EOL97_10370 [Spirochaetia bacterium]|nr:hypothetical protein [Spirochaetia bacterium]
MTIKNKKNRDIEALYKFQQGNIYKVKNVRIKDKSVKKPSSLLSKIKLKKRNKTIIKDVDTRYIGGQIFVSTDSSQNTSLDPI